VCLIARLSVLPGLTKQEIHGLPVMELRKTVKTGRKVDSLSCRNSPVSGMGKRQISRKDAKTQRRKDGKMEKWVTLVGKGAFGQDY
jgi:hypothetical protein